MRYITTFLESIANETNQTDEGSSVSGIAADFETISDSICDVK